MRGLVRQIGCVTLIVLGAVGGWMLRGRLFPREGATPVGAIVWEPLTTERAERGRLAVVRLGRPAGPALETLTGGELASYIFVSLPSELPPSADSVQAAVIGDRLAVRAWVKLSDLGGTTMLGPLAGMFGEREWVQFGGTFDVLREGLAQYRIQDLRIREFNVPARLIASIITRMDRGARPEGVAPNALPLEVPAGIGDVRIARGRVILYRDAAP